MSLELPNFQQLVGNQSERLNGIKSWENLKIIGKNNLERIVQLSQENIYKMMSEGESPEEMKEIRVGIDYIKNELIPKSLQKPNLPRLRNESFHKDDKVVTYLGDTLEIISETDWINGIVIAVNKAFNKDWADGKPNSGYFWKVTVQTPNNVFPNKNTFVFSTSEPRVLFDWEYDYLKNSGDFDFLQIFSDNAFREWKPLWCIENDFENDASKMNMKDWILNGKVVD